LSFEEKYAVSKRRKQIGTFTAREIIRLLKIRELSTIHKVKVEDKEITAGEFASAHEAGELPEQNVTEATPEETKPKETKSKKAEKVTPKVSSSSTPPVKPKPAPSSPPPSKPKSAKPTSPPKPSPTAHPPTGNDSPPPIKSADHKPLRPVKAKEDSRQAVSLAKRNENSGAKRDGPKIKMTGTAGYTPPKKHGRGVSLLRKALLIGTFVVIAYGCASLFNHQKMQSKIESLFQQSSPIDDIEVSEFTLEGYYLIDNPRKATVEILRNGKEARTYHFKVSGNGITSKVQMEME
jgi:hypothetical protein